MDPLGPPGSARPPLPEIPAWDERAAQQSGTKLRERDLVRAGAAVLRLRLTTGADLAEADSLLGKLRRDPNDAASWQKLAAALRSVVDGTDDRTLDGDLPPEQAAFVAAVRQHLLSPDEPEIP